MTGIAEPQDTIKSVPRLLRIPVYDPSKPSKQTSLLVGSWHKDETYSHGVYWVEEDLILNADGTYSQSSSFGQKKGQYFYNETLNTLTLSGTYISGDYKGDTRTSSFTVLSLSETDLVLQFVAEAGLITYHYKRVK